MALYINDLRKQKAGSHYVSPARICLTADDEVCSADDPRAVKLLVGEGGSIPNAMAEQYGLLGQPEEAKASANKRRKDIEDK